MKTTLVLLLLSLACCRSSHSQDVYESKRYGYNFTIPDTWDAQEVGGSVDVYPSKLSGIRKGDVYVIVYSEETLGCKTIDECYQFYVLDRFKDQFEGAVIAEGTGNLNGLEARWLEYKAAHDGDPRMYLVYIAFTPKRLFLIECWSDDELFSKSKRTFEALAKSFRIN
jgi:hypothetical protein